MIADTEELLASIQAVFADRGEAIVEVNQRAFRAGRERAVQARLHPGPRRAPPDVQMREILMQADREGRTRLHEHEVYRLLELSREVAVPRHRFIPAGQPITAADLLALGSDRVVVKIVSPQLTHKSHEGGVVVVPLGVEAVGAAADQILARCRERGIPTQGVLLAEYVPHDAGRLGGQLFVGIRATRDFGPVLVAGLGGTDAEYLAERFPRRAAVATMPALECSAEAFLDHFRQTVAYELLSGQVRGHARCIDDNALLRCFSAFLQIAQRFGTVGPRGLVEFEINPFAVADGRLVALDGRAQIGDLPAAEPARPSPAVQRLLEPRSIAVMGVSAKRANFGRIILNNIQRCGFDPQRLYVLKEDADIIDGARCYASIRDLPEPVDLLVAATGAEQVEKVVRDLACVDDLSPPSCAAVILISGAVGEKEGTEHFQHDLREIIGAGRRQGRDGPVFLGANCMGVRSRPGRYDTFFIPPHKLDPRQQARPRRVAIISQSGAFIITRLSNLQFIDPPLAVSLGNQLDLTVSDLVRVIGERDDIDCLGVYVEGFNALDGLELVRAVRASTGRGKAIVFYKAGRTAAGRSAAQGHTASLAGDWDVCAAALAAAGAMVATGFAEFEHLLELAANLHDKPVRGGRIAAVSNAGFETVGMADALRGAAHQLQMPQLSQHTRRRIEGILDKHGLAGLVNLRNPLDLTPMANDEAYEQACAALLDASEYDAVAVGCVPMSPQLLTTPEEVKQEGSIAHRIVHLCRAAPKPLVFIVDSGAPYDVLAAAVRAEGVPVFRTADTAIACLGQYLAHRLRSGVPPPCVEPRLQS